MLVNWYEYSKPLALQLCTAHDPEPYNPQAPENKQTNKQTNTHTHTRTRTHAHTHTHIHPRARLGGSTSTLGTYIHHG